MILECSLDLKKCSCDRNFCRKSSQIYSYDHNNEDIIPYYKRQSKSISKHLDMTGAYLLGILICFVMCCIIIPICGIILGPIMYYLRILIIQSSNVIPTLSPTLSPTLFLESRNLIDTVNNSLNNNTNITL